jgi:Domain of unknown function (DUF4203)
MSIEGILIGLLAIGIGAAWATYGLKAFTILLPIWAFFAGLLIGASLTVELLGDGFFATVTSWIVALATGVVFALLSYFIYYAAVIILGATAGYALGAGLLTAIGLDGFLAVVVGLIGGVILALAVLVLAVPAILVVVVSAFSGAAAVVNGALILLGSIQLEDVDAGLMEGLLKYGPVAVVAWLVIAAGGIWYQWRDIGRDVDRIAIERSSYRIA